MTEQIEYVKHFKDIGRGEVPRFGGKNASLGELIKIVPVPTGFATDSKAFDYIIDYNKIQYEGEQITLRDYIKKELEGIDEHLRSDDPKSIGVVKNTVARIRGEIEKAEYPAEVKKQILEQYEKLEKETGGSVYAVRSSATAEDLPDASFAGQQDTHLNIFGKNEILEYVLKDMASVFTTRATQYRERAGFSHFDVKLSVGVQEMVGGKEGVECSGVAFSLDPDSGNKNVIVVRSGFGLGEKIVGGEEQGDEYILFKYGTGTGAGPALVNSTMVPQDEMMVYDKLGTKSIPVPEDKRKKLTLNRQQAEKLGTYVKLIERNYRENKDAEYVDVEWAMGKDGKLWFVQARPETVESQKGDTEHIFYLLEDEEVLIEQGKLFHDKGSAIGRKIGSGRLKYIKSVDDAHLLEKGDVLLTEETNPDWTSYMQHLGGVITERGSPTCHAAIVSRELGIPGVVGSEGMVKKAKKLMGGNKDISITVDCSKGDPYIWNGDVPYDYDEIDFNKLPRPKTQIQVNLGMPKGALSSGKYPDGTGLARLEFIIADDIQVHPNLLINYEKLSEELEDISVFKRIFNKEERERYRNLKKDIELVQEVTAGCPGSETDFYVQKLAEGLGTIAAAVWKPDSDSDECVVRMSDFKTNEYKNLAGGWLYESEEHNPMMGFRGASRYVSPDFEEAFRLECRAVKKARDWGLKNVIPMIPFCRTVPEAKAVQKLMAEEGLVREEFVQHLVNEKGWNRGKVLREVMKEGKVRDEVFKAIEQGRNAPADYPEGLKMYVMAEIPSNITMADEFSKYFDGFSIGSNDLTQLTFGVGRDNEKLSGMAKKYGYETHNEAVKRRISHLIHTAHSFKINDELAPRKVGICGQAPSDYPEFLQFLVREGIDKISLNFDTFAKGRINAYRTEVIEDSLESDEQKKEVYGLLNQYDSMIGELRVHRGRMRFLKKKLDVHQEADGKLDQIVDEFDTLTNTLTKASNGIVEKIGNGHGIKLNDLLGTEKNLLDVKLGQLEGLIEYAKDRWKNRK